MPGHTMPKSLAFIAGYIAGVITPDWRAGILLPADQGQCHIAPSGIQQRFALLVWAVPAGICPFVVYPQSAQITNPSDAVATLSTVDTLTNLGVTTVYVPGEVTTTALLEYIAQKQVMMIGTGNPPPGVANLWVVSLRTGNPIDSFRHRLESSAEGMGESISRFRLSWRKPAQGFWMKPASELSMKCWPNYRTA